MELTLDNYSNLLTKDLIGAIRKTTVRECDEIAPGEFVAYVDEGGDSFDVAITLMEKQVQSHQCDCGSNTAFCRHKAALLQHIAGNRRVGAALRSKKRSKTELLLEEVDTTALKVWVLELLQKNKDLELAFTHRFGTEAYAYQPAEVKKLTHDVVKAVAGQKKHIDAAALKRIVDLWQDVHAPVIKNALSDITADTCLENLHTLLDCCTEVHWKSSTTSSRILTYTDNILEQVMIAIHSLEQEAAWDKAVGFWVASIPDGKYGLRLHYLNHLGKLLDGSSHMRKQRLAAALAEQYRVCQTEYLHNGSRYTYLLLQVLTAANMFGTYASLIKPIRYDHEFNQRLIEQLVAHNELDLAAQCCKQQMQGTSRDAYSQPYLELLRDVYTRQGNNEGLAEVLGQLLPRTYDFDAYLFLYNRMTDDAQQKLWRNQMMVKAKTGSGSHNPQATAFVFCLLDHEGAYRKMIDNITYGTPYEVLCKYFKPMFETDAPLFLEALLRKTDSWAIGLWYEAVQADRQFLPRLVDLVLEHYDAATLGQWMLQTQRRQLGTKSSYAVLHAVKERLQQDASNFD